MRRHQRNSKAYWFTYQSGLYTLSGYAKPAAAAYAMPFLATNTGALDPATGMQVFSLWGQLRLLPNNRTAGVLATIQWRDKSNPAAPWTTVTSVPVDAMGYFTTTVASPAPVLSEWRSALVNPADGAPIATSPGSG